MFFPPDLTPTPTHLLHAACPHNLPLYPGRSLTTSHSADASLYGQKFKFVWIMYFDCTLSFMDSNNFFINELQTFHKRTNTPPKKIEDITYFWHPQKAIQPALDLGCQTAISFCFLDPQAFHNLGFHNPSYTSCIPEPIAEINKALIDLLFLLLGN